VWCGDRQMPETRTVKGFSEVLIPLAEGDFESGPL